MLLVIIMMTNKKMMIVIINNCMLASYTGTSIVHGVATTKHYTLMHET